MSQTIGYLGLGANLGDPLKNLREGIRRLGSHPEIEILKQSSFYKTAPWGKKDQPPFVNLCLKIATDLGPEELLGVTQGIEKAMGRIKKEQWGPRPIDIDILLYGDLELLTENLKIPHPHMTQRAFVLVPLREIEPELKIQGEAIAGYLETIGEEGIEKIQ
ncbi:MAG: hypothetical protein AVO33_08250 [delta proteobacterium ML8_F1]|nr:MAG: hypothetical protein AVO33_08250 [delta proteobacterium ML8_F1]